MRRVAQHVAALAQGIENQRQVHLLEIANPAMRELGAAAGGSLGEIEALDQQRAIAAGGGFDRRAQAGGSAANHQHVPGFGFAPSPEDFLLSVTPDISVHARHCGSRTSHVVQTVAATSSSQRLRSRFRGSRPIPRCQQRAESKGVPRQPWTRPATLIVLCQLFRVSK